MSKVKNARAEMRPYDNMNNKKREGVGRYIVNCLVCFIVATLASSCLIGLLRDKNILTLIPDVMLYALVTCAVASVWFYNKKTFLITSSVFLTAILLIILGAFPSVTEFIDGFIKWAPSNLFLVKAGQDVYTEAGVIVITGAITVIMHLAAVKLKKVIIVAVSTSALMTVAYFYAGAIQYRSFDSTWIIVCLMAALVAFAFWFNYQRSSKGNPLTATVLVSVLLIGILIVSPGITSQRGSLEADRAISELINAVSKREDLMTVKTPAFSLNESGFASSDSKTLGGKLELDHNAVFSMTSYSPRLLRGAVYTTYTGSTWTRQSETGTLLEEEKFSSELLPSSSKYEDVFDYQQLTKRLILNKDFNQYKIYNMLGTSRILLNDINTVRIGFTKAKNIYTDQYGITFANENVKYTDVYSVMYANTQYEPSQLSQYVESNDVVNDYPESIARFRNTEGIPQSVLDLARAIVGNNTKTDYDAATKIKQYIESNYTYSLDVEEVPEGRDFAEHFLFDTKTGYCTYFATAMTLLCRSVGLPARYIEGYRNDGIGLTKVLNSNAHAWTEVFIKNVGWVPFDLITSYDFRSQNQQTATVRPTVTSTPSQNTVTEKPTSPTVPSPTATAEVTAATLTPSASSAPSASPSASLGAMVPSVTTEPTGGGGSDIIIYLCIVVVCCAFIAFIAFTKYKKNCAIKRLANRMNANDVKHIYCSICADAKKLGFKYRDDMTVDQAIYELRNYFADKLNVELSTDHIDRVIKCVNEAAYANKHTDKQSREAMMYLYDEVCGRAAKKRGVIAEAVVFIIRGV